MSKIRGVTSANEPKDQKETERASALVTIESTNPTMAVNIAETPIPIVINCKAERASEKVKSVASRILVVGLCDLKRLFERFFNLAVEPVFNGVGDKTRGNKEKQHGRDQ